MFSSISYMYMHSRLESPGGILEHRSTGRNLVFSTGTPCSVRPSAFVHIVVPLSDPSEKKHGARKRTADSIPTVERKDYLCPHFSKNLFYN